MAAQPEVNQDEFLACARYGELEDMLKELEKGADVNCKGSMGNTALHAACANGHEAVVKELLARGADASKANDAGNTPAHYAAQQKHAPCLRLVLTDSLQKNSFGRSTLTEAIAAGDGACATVALEHESCAEEKIIEGLEKVEVDDDEDAPQTITHTLTLGEKVRIRELPIADKATDALGDGSGATDRTGLGVWAAAVVLGRWLAEKSSDFEEKRVVELGAGCGVGALALAASCSTCSVIATDAAPEALENCRHNVDLFGEDRGNSEVTHGPLKATKRVSVQALDWDAPPEPVCGRPAPPLTADSGLFYESGAMFAGGKNTASVSPTPSTRLTVSTQAARGSTAMSLWARTSSTRKLLWRSCARRSWRWAVPASTTARRRRAGRARPSSSPGWRLWGLRGRPRTRLLRIQKPRARARRSTSRTSRTRASSSTRSRARSRRRRPTRP